jgi:RNA polymerase sigma-70 factor, ECF subfamily
MRESRAEKRRRFELEVLPELDILFAVASYLARDTEQANDFCEKTMVHAYETFNHAVTEANCRAWLLTILHAVARESATAASTITDRAAISPAASAERRADDHVDHALQSLPDDFKAALMLVDIGRLSYRDAAKVLEVPAETVRIRISKGRALMRDAIAPRGRGLARA